MIKLLLIVIGCYVFAAAMVHVYYALAGHKKNENRHYILLAGQSTDHVEWYYRSLKRFSVWMGIPVQMTIIHEQPTGELKQMVDCWNRQFNDIAVAEQFILASENDIVIDLSRKGDLWKFPF